MAEPAPEGTRDRSRGALFPLGQVVATQGALRALEHAEQMPHAFLDQHAHGAWGDLGEEDWEANERALREGLRLVSVYSTSAGEKLFIITEWDRSVTIMWN